MEKKNPWEIDTEELMKAYGSTRAGLSLLDVAQRQEKYGKNVLLEEKKKNFLQVFLSQFADLLVVILVIAAIISGISGSRESTIVILAVLLMNALLGTIEHMNAEKSLDSLKALTTPTARVIRLGKAIQLAASELVPGDIVELEAGDMVVADGRLIDAFSFQVNESSLTGESTAVEKSTQIISGQAPLADRTNMVFSGSLVTNGRASVLITATGMETELGKIAELLNVTKDRKTPLQKSLDSFSQKLAIGIMLICILVFVLCLYRKIDALDSMMFAVSLAVAAIPEALGSIVTIVQAMGTKKMARKNAIIKDLKAVESLGCVSVICSDKTGTLTQNKMTVQEIYVYGQTLLPWQIDTSNDIQKLLIYDAMLCNSATISDGKGIGDPTECALLEMYPATDSKAASGSENSQGIKEAIGLNIRQDYPVLEELPFDSDRKLMSVKVALQNQDIIFTKGAVDMLLDRCDSIYTSSGVMPLTKAELEKIEAQNKNFAQKGLRVLAFAYKKSNQPLSLEAENKLIFLGLIAMIDPPRQESHDAVLAASLAGIKPVMITGDHKITATAIAKAVGIYHPGDMAVTGLELDSMSDDELLGKIENISVYARVSPENKIRIVDAWQKKGHVVAMTGDGVNDAPALKKADIGVAMGITGTEVSKDAAAMILADDNFATIVKAVENGRAVYRNIKNAILFLLSGNLAGIITVLYAVLAGLSMPFAPVHLLFINLLTDSLPALAIGMEPEGEGLLLRAPRRSNEGILTGEFLKKMIVSGVLIAIATLFAFGLGLKSDGATASTMAFATLCLARLFHGFNCRGDAPIYSLGFSSNPYSIYAFLLGLVFLCIVLFVPGLYTLFSIAPLKAWQLIAILLLAIYPTFIIQIVRIIRSR